jgi:diguanylate cyclase (GGDEF)-like protein
MASWAAFDHRKIKRQMEQLTDKLTLQQAELEGVRVNNRDRTLEAVQRSRENRKLTRELIKEREESELDGMTKAYTKKSGMQKLYRVMNQHLGRNPIGFAMADIDFFKKVNDSYGHPGGDKVIQKFAEIMMRNFRKHDDFLIRYGGEEFVIVFPNLPLKEMISVLRRIQTDVCAAQIYVKNLQGEEVLVASTILLGSSLTFSCGFAELSEVPSYEAALEMMKSRDFQEIDPEREEAVFECFSVLIEDIKTLADKRLYHAKQSGRNQVCGPEEAVIPQIESRFARAKEFKAS